MERFKKVLNPLVILLGVIIILIVKLEQSKQDRRRTHRSYEKWI